MSYSEINMDQEQVENPSLSIVKNLYSEKDYQTAIDTGEQLLPSCTNPRLCSELHLLLAKCHKGIGDLKTCISSCNSAIEKYSKWKEPFLYRSACYQALHTSYLETNGDTEENIDEDRNRADIIVDPNREPTAEQTPEEKEKERLKRNRLLFRPDEQIEKKAQRVVHQIDEALRLANDGEVIFVEKGVYCVSAGARKELSSYFLLGKNISIIGASTRDCVLVYKKDDDEQDDTKVTNQLETFLICAGQSKVPTLIKRFTFRNQNHSWVKTKFFGIAGGRVQIEDCLFDGVDKSEVDAVYTNSKICGNLANSYPSPSVSLRFCVFDHCQGYGALTFSHSLGSVHCCYFTGCGRTAVAAVDSAKVKVENCEFAMTEMTESIISCTSSDITVVGNYLQGVQVGESTSHLTSHAVGVMLKSVARVENNYIYKTGCGIFGSNSDINSSRNMIYSCSQRYSGSQGSTTLGLLSGISVRGKTKVQLVDNLTKHCDVGLHVTESAMPTVKDNVLDSSFFSGLFAESGARPNIVSNTFCGGDGGSQLPRGIGVLFIGEAGGLVGKNQFQDYEVSPVMVFTKCHPMLKHNIYNDVKLSEDKQAVMEKGLLIQFQSQVEEDSNFYLVESSDREATLAEVIFKGLPSH